MSHDDYEAERDEAEYYAEMERDLRPREVKCTVCKTVAVAPETALRKAGWLLYQGEEVCPIPNTIHAHYRVGFLCGEAGPVSKVEGMCPF